MITIVFNMISPKVKEDVSAFDDRYNRLCFYEIVTSNRPRKIVYLRSIPGGD